MSFESEMQLHYLTMSYQETTGLEHPAIRVWLAADTKVLPLKREEIAYRYWLARTVNPCVLDSFVTVFNLACNTALECVDPAAKGSPAWNLCRDYRVRRITCNAYHERTAALSGKVPRALRDFYATLERHVLTPDDPAEFYIRDDYATCVTVLGACLAKQRFALNYNVGNTKRAAREQLIRGVALLDGIELSP